MKHVREETRPDGGVTRYTTFDDAADGFLSLGIVGSVELVNSLGAEKIIDDVLTEFMPYRVVSGGARGLDTLAVRRAHLRKINTVEHFPAGQSWEFFKPRNLLVAADSENLIRIVAEGSKTYDSGWTRDRVEERGGYTREYRV